ncbi:uncharacterized protein LOC134697729 [Mytilus trossulus]|uniref:uncharacterized protein LOC134697729 n=1 Tax=Mytilus trossulus TaxID=6551 RepID=UPI0030044497
MCILPWYKFLLRGSLDAIECDVEYYQPFKFWANVSSECLLRKSECTEEGQITIDRGNSTFDRKCRCDYTQGYTFIKTPVNECFCMPSVEDCSCHKGLCPIDHILTPDYGCVKQEEWTGHYVCPTIKITMLKGEECSTRPTPVPTFDTPGPDIPNIIRAEEPMSANVWFTVIIVAGSIAVLIGLKCLPKCYKLQSEIVRKDEINTRLKEQEEGVKDYVNEQMKHNLEEYVQDYMKSKENEVNEKIPPKIQEKYSQHIEEWNNDNDKYIITEATDYIDERLRNNNCVLVIGRQGGGKSSIIRHIALKLYTNESYDIIPIVLGPHDILDYHNENRKQIFVIDDFCGKLVINAQNVDLWSIQIDDVLKLIETDEDRQTEGQGLVKFLFATNEDIFNDKIFGNRLQQLSPFYCKLSEKPLKDSEKLQMIRKYIPTEEANIKETMLSHEVYFPLLCKISEGKTADQIVKLFANLNDFIKQDLLALKDTSVLHFCIITLCALFENCFDEKMLNENFRFANSKEEKAFNEICAEFNLGLHKESNRMRLKEQLQSVGETYVSKTGDYYSLIHSKVYQVAEIVCAKSFINCFIKFAPISFIAARYRFKSTTVEKNGNVVWINEADTEKRYFNRLFMDLEEGVTYSTFHNAQLCNITYREKFCTYCTKRKEKLTELLLRIKESNKALLLNEQSSPDDHPDYEDYLDFKEQYHFMDHKMRKPLIESAWEGCSDIAKMLLEMECDVDETDKFGRTALFVASYRNKTNVAIKLIEKGAQHDLCNAKGQSPLFIAARHGNYDIIKALLKKKASTELCDPSGQTSLMVASTCGNKDVVEALLKAGANISKCDNVGRSSLFLASLNERKDVVNFLIRNKANVHQCNKTGLSPLSVACGKENSDLLDILIKAGADISKEDNNGRSPLFIACEGGFDNIVDILINKGANVMKCDWENKSPLLIACEKGHLKIVQSLIKSNSSMINLCDEDGRSPLFVACQKRRTQIAGFLLENGANLNSFDNKSRSPFYAACRSGDLAIVKLLYTKGVTKNHCNIWGSSPLFVASREGHFNVVEYLIDLKSDVSKADSNEKTPLIVACEEGNVRIARILMESGADVNHCDKEKRSSLHVASFCGHTDIVKLLLMYLADQTLRDIDEHTPLEIAHRKEFADIVALLTSKELSLNTYH